MATRTDGEHRYGSNHADLRDEVRAFSEARGYPAQHFADAACRCGARRFRLSLDGVEGVAVRTCSSCGAIHPIGDSDEYMHDAELAECACPCGGEEFEIAVGVSLYEDSEDIRWLYLGGRCTRCGMIAVYGDWKNEFIGYRELLARV